MNPRYLPEDPIERLARRTAEENDRLARRRLEEYYRARNRPIQISEWPAWFLWLPVVLTLIALGLILPSFAR